MKTNQFYLGVLGVCALLTAGSANAEDFAQASAMKQASMTQGFGRATLPVLQRAAASNPAQVSAALLGKLCANCAVSKATQGTNLQITGANLVLSISGDGTAADFRDVSVQAKAHSLAKPLDGRMPLIALEKAGRTFVASKLASVIALGPGEQLVALSTDYRVEGLQNLSTGAVTQSVVANRVVFGRTLNGVPVVGNGSTVIVTFANDGSVESFHYDWPKYETAAGLTGQNLVNASDLLARVQQVVGARTGAAVTSTVRVPTVTEAATGAVELNLGTKLQSLQCGYYDAGAAEGHAQVQPGCVYHAVFADTTGMRQGYAGAVPGGLQFQPDAKWPETQVLKQ
jgi:hypothetical protein